MLAKMQKNTGLNTLQLCIWPYCKLYFALKMHAFAQIKISSNIIPPHVKISIKHDMRELFLKYKVSTIFKRQF
jgi:hypothetical protein